MSIEELVADAIAAMAVASSLKPATPKSYPVAATQNGATLPNTATDAQLRLWLGLALCLAGVILVAIRRRRHHPARCLPY